MINKKGEHDESVESNLGGMILAILVSLLIVGGGLLAWKKLSTDNDVEAAQRIADQIKSAIDALEQEKSGIVELQGSEGLQKNQWIIIGWSKNQEGRPDMCYFKTCLLLCPNNDKTKSEACIKRDLEEDVIDIVNFIEITTQAGGIDAVGGDPTISASLQNQRTETEMVKINSISLPNLRFRLEIEKGITEDKKIFIKISEKK